MVSLDDPLEEFRAAEYPDASSSIYLNTASYGLLPLRVGRAVSSFALRRNRPNGLPESEIGGSLRRARRAVGLLLDASEDDITLVSSTSFGVNLGAALVGSREPGTIVLYEGEFPANVYPWLALERRGFEVETVPGGRLSRPDQERIADRITRGGNVRALALSAVQFSSGYMADLDFFGRLCRERDILFVVDAIQAMGVVDIRPAGLNVDLLTAGGQKWLCSPWGSGFTWIDPRHRESFDPPMVSWLAMEAAADFTDILDFRWGFVKSGRKFELASLGVQDHLGLAHSVELFLELGIDRIRSHIFALHEPVMRWIEGRDDVTLVTPADPEERAGILAFRVSEPNHVAARMAEAGAVVAVREGSIRLSPHWYNTRVQMEEVVGMLEQWVVRP